MPQRQPSCIHVLQNRVLHQHPEIAVVLVQPADADFDVLDQLVVIIGLGQHIDFREVQRNRVGPVVAASRGSVCGC